MSVSATATTYEVGSRDVRVLRALAGGSRTVKEISAASGQSATTVRRALDELRSWGLVAQSGTIGRTATYALTTTGSRSWSRYPQR